MTLTPFGTAPELLNVNIDFAFLRLLTPEQLAALSVEARQFRVPFNSFQIAAELLKAILERRSDGGKPPRRNLTKSAKRLGAAKGTSPRLND